MNSRYAGLAALVATVLLLAGCASPFQSGPRTGNQGIGIVVENDAPSVPIISVHIVMPSGNQRFLGTVSPGQAQRFRWTEQISPGQYELIAEAGSQRLRSRPFYLTENGIRWSVSSNLVSPLLGN